MKTLFLKNVLPAAVVALAISGAFLTTSMQSAPEKSAVAFKWGYVPNANGTCSSIQVPCSDIQKPQLCQMGTAGAVAYERDNQNNCVQPLYRLVNGQ
ncbi:DUF6520 family protein [Flavobacterium piscisymbiosum]|uniref:DUF6520 family protein n=1 Tax=Flavobacterium piscisymbiosum TaxID=2893753 RepID=A0ABS8ME47_9FLAO|nr:DUF6520 family protein [Flavobacterium sp. F-30]MCC9063633.1 DUF6520 family protein [Flavobacterium sp. F-30]